MNIIRKRMLTAIAALTLLSGCGVDEPPDPVRTTAVSGMTSTAATTAATTEEPHTLRMRIGYHRMSNISDADAEALVSEILAQKEIKTPAFDKNSETYIVSTQQLNTNADTKKSHHFRSDKCKVFESDSQKSLHL